MKLQEKQKELEQEIIANLRAIPKMPEGLLPHTVYVEEEGEDAEHHGIPVYTVYKLEEIRPDGSCMLYNPDSRERFPCRHLYEINIDWLVTVWERYLELCVAQKLCPSRSPRKRRSPPPFYPCFLSGKRRRSVSRVSARRIAPDTVPKR